MRLDRFSGSFRDPSARVYDHQGRVIRGVDQTTAANFSALADAPFFRRELEKSRVVGTTYLDSSDPVTTAVVAGGWAAALEHERVPLISYPYEWTFSMLKDAALLQLELLAEGFDEGWILKDSTPYNVQFVGSQPVFIDVPSFVPRSAGEPWGGYRQFCMLYLYPLLLQAHLGIPFQPVLRSNLDGLTPVETARYFRGWRRLKSGVLSHIMFPAAMERWVESREKNRAPAKHRSGGRQSDVSIRSLIGSIQRLVSTLNVPIKHTAWSEYATSHSYDTQDVTEKREFVRAAAERAQPKIAWDIGCNTGDYAEICAAYARHVIAVDADHDAVESLYRRLRERSANNILPLVMNLANISPSQGWSGRERLSFDERNRPELVVALALIHHMCLSANVPIALFLEWLSSLGGHLVIEFVDREDEMVKKLLTNKTEQYADYNKATFLRELESRYQIVARKSLKNGQREVFHCFKK